MPNVAPVQQASPVEDASTAAAEDAHEQQNNDESNEASSAFGSTASYGSYGYQAPAATNTNANSQSASSDKDDNEEGRRRANELNEASIKAEEERMQQSMALLEYWGLMNNQAIEAVSNRCANLRNLWHDAGADPVYIMDHPDSYHGVFDDWYDRTEARYECEEINEMANRFFTSGEFLPPSILTAENAEKAQKYYDQVSIIWSETKKAADLLTAYCAARAACPDVNKCPECFLPLVTPHIRRFDRGSEKWSIDHLENAREALNVLDDMPHP